MRMRTETGPVGIIYGCEADGWRGTVAVGACRASGTQRERGIGRKRRGMKEMIMMIIGVGNGLHGKEPAAVKGSVEEPFRFRTRFPSLQPNLYRDKISPQVGDQLFPVDAMLLVSSLFRSSAHICMHYLRHAGLVFDLLPVSISPSLRRPLSSSRSAHRFSSTSNFTRTH